MLFNSIDFAIFLPVVFILYWFVTNRSLKLQNLLIVAASYLFYGWWDWRFLSLILFSTIIDYLVGIGLSKQKNQTKRFFLLGTSIIVNLGFLAFFKYYNFFLDNFITAFSFFGTEIKANSLNIVLPVGISFYTFQTLSYSIDVYRRKLEPTKDFIAFAAFVSFFPQLVAGPIERATHLLHQIYSKRQFDETLALQGFFQALWGLFKKMVIADNCAPLVNTIFESDYSSGSILVLGAVLFAFQIYGDFSGYSDIAIGVSKMFGIRLMTNFRFPYFSRNIGEFWRKWHISLSSWFRDYLYIPLGGSKVNKLQSIRNVFIIFLVSGFWHGANWTFIIWGGFHAMLFLPSFIFGSNKKYHGAEINFENFLHSTENFFKILKTFCLVTIGWIFFRAQSLSQALSYLDGIFHKSLISIPKLRGQDNTNMLIIILLIIILIIIEWRNKNNEFVFENAIFKSTTHQLLIIGLIVTGIYFFSGITQDFIYFQF